MKQDIKRIDWKSTGPCDLIPQLNRGQRYATESLIEFGSFEPPDGGNKSRCMRAICMVAEGSAYYYAITGDQDTLKAIKKAVEKFRKYRHIARARRIPYPEAGNDASIEYEMIAIHVGRNMRGMRAVAHILEDEQLLREVGEELNWWLDSPPGYDWKNHRFENRLWIDEEGKVDTKRLEDRHTMNLLSSLASVMWLVGNDLDDDRLKSTAVDQILNGVIPYQFESGYWPYCYNVFDLTGESIGRTDLYHALTVTVLSPLLAYDFWQKQEPYIEALRKGCAYLRSLTNEAGMINGKGAILRSPGLEVSFWDRTSKLWHVTADSVLSNIRLYRYLGDQEAFRQAALNLRWLHYNAPMCIPYFPPQKIDDQQVITEWGYSHAFRQIIISAYEGLHLQQTDANDVQAVFIDPES